MSSTFLATTVSRPELAQATCLALLANASPEATRLFDEARTEATKMFIPTSARLHRGSSLSELSGIDVAGRSLRVGPPAEIRSWLEKQAALLSTQTLAALTLFEKNKTAALIVADAGGDLGLIVLGKAYRLENCSSSYCPSFMSLA